MLLINTLAGPHRDTIPLVLDGKPAPIYYVCLEIRPECNPKLPLLGHIDDSLMPLHSAVLISMHAFRYSVLTDTQTA